MIKKRGKYRFFKACLFKAKHWWQFSFDLIDFMFDQEFLVCGLDIEDFEITIENDADYWLVVNDRNASLILR